MCREGGAERLDALRPDREPGSGTVAAESLELRGAGSERGVEVEAGDRTAGALPVAVGASDQHHRATVLLDQARRDDADHPLVPALVGDDVTTLRPPRFRPGL